MGNWTFGCWRDIPNCNGMSLALWLKFNAYPTTKEEFYGIVSSLETGLANGFFLRMWDHTTYGGKELTFGFLRSGSTEGVWVDSAFPTLGVWSHWVYTMSYIGSPHIKAYKDGVPATVNEYECCSIFGASDFGTKERLAFGNYFVDDIVGGHPYYPDIVIDDVLIFDFILSAAEVSMVYNV